MAYISKDFRLTKKCITPVALLALMEHAHEIITIKKKEFL